MFKLLRLSIIGICLLMFTQSAWAQPIRVKANATGANNGTSWADAYTSLTTALANAPAGAEIWLAAGTYKPVVNAQIALSHFLIDKKVEIYGGFAGTETSQSQRNFLTNKAILSGDHNGNDISGDYVTNRTDNSYHVVFINAVGATPILDGIYITNGSAPAVAANVMIDNRGGGLLAVTVCNLRNCTFNENSATAGGGVSVASPDASNSVIENCTFEKNGTNLQGTSLHFEQIQGAIVKKCVFKNNTGLRGALHTRFSSAITVDSCLFEGNNGLASLGSGLYIWNSSMSVLRCYFKSNTCVSGGGAMYCNQQDGGTFVNVQGCNFEGNTATGAGVRGGAVTLFRGAVQFDGCKFKSNMSAGSGGAINNAAGTQYNYNLCEFETNMGNFGGACVNYDTTSGTYNNCKFIGNMANSGGGALSYGFRASGTINFTEFSGNKANTIGGAVYMQNDLTTLSMNSCFISGNEAVNSGGGFYQRAGTSANINQCDFLANTSDTGGGVNIRQDSVNLRPILNVSRSTFVLNNAATQGGAFNLSNANVTLTNCVAGGNSAVAAGGGGFSNNAGNGQECTLRLVSCTVANNSATLGSGVANWQEDSTSSKALLSTINTIYENQGFNYAVEAGTPSVISNDGNHSSDPTFGAAFNGPKDVAGTSAQMVDPTIDDYHLKSTSPCVNSAALTGAPAYDLEGGLRDAQPDKGAYELGSVGTFTPAANDFEFKLLPNPTAGALRVELPVVLNGTATLRLYNQLGALVQEASFENQGAAERFDVYGQPSGQYILMIEVAGKQAGASVIKI
jgi:predicted outer membrane repeat protein